MQGLSRFELTHLRDLMSSAPAASSSQVPGRKKVGGREGRSRSLKRKLFVCTEK